MVIIEKPPASWPYPDPNSYSNFDECLVEKFHLDITPDFDRKVLQTKIKITARALQPTRQLVLDTRRLDIKSVTSNGRALKYEVIQDSQALGTGIAFDLGEELAAGSYTEV
jgi:aminopeptidase N